MITINHLAKKYALSRSTLLYYDKIGLLKPSGRSNANYRLYSSEDIQKLEKITLYKQAGLSLETIAQLIQSDTSQASTVLEQRLEHLNQEISDLRQQQQLIISLLGKDSLIRTTKTMNKNQWVNILRASGMDDDAMHKWHIEFERDLPQVHSDFLASLGCSADEIQQIRAWSQVE